MSVDKNGHRCMCDIINEVVVDGDTESVYHSACEGFLGDVSDITVDRLPKSRKKAEKSAFELQGEISEYLFGSTRRNHE